MTFGILALEAGAIVSTRFGLPITSWVLHASALVAAVVLIVLFQPELRHALSRLEITLRWPRQRAVLMGALEAISNATFSLATAKRGALLVIERREPVAELVRGGVPLGGQVSPEILEAIFRKVSPVHDRATLIEGDHIIRVGAILPLSQTEALPRMWGTRHRAGMALAERCDAPVIVASEERGEVTLMHDSSVETVRTADALLDSLRTLMPPPPIRPSRWQIFNRRELGLQALAAAIAFAIWTRSCIRAAQCAFGPYPSNSRTWHLAFESRSNPLWPSTCACGVRAGYSIPPGRIRSSFVSAWRPRRGRTLGRDLARATTAASRSVRR